MVVEDVPVDDSPLRPAPVLVVRVRRRKGALRCSRCGRKCPKYDDGGGERRWRHQDFGRYGVEPMAPRVACAEHGVAVAQVPWAEPGSRFTRDFEMECAWLTAVASRKTVGGFLRLKNGKILSEMEFANDQVSQASFMMPNSTRVVMLDDPKAVDDTFDNTDNISRRSNGIWESPYERETKALRRLLGRSGPNGSESSIANQILAQQDLSELTAHLASAFPFKISPSSDGRMLISGSKSNLSEPILASNASAGGKATMLLRYLFEEHMLRSGDFLILDEPEIHLHPQLQIAYARYIVGAAQKIGVRVLLTTHSPYFLQALITYSQLFGFKQQLSVYSAQSQTNQSIIVEEDNKGIARIFENMAQPFLTLERDIVNDLTGGNHAEL